MTTPAGTAPATSVGELVERLASELLRNGIENPTAEARELVAALYDAPRFWPIANAGNAVDDAHRTRATEALRLRLLGAPLAYAVGRAAFRTLSLAVDERVLIPRPETERLVDLVLEHASRLAGGIAIDACTGSGAIALSLAAEGSFSRVYGTDISRDALAVARLNVDACANVLRAPIDLVEGSLLAPLSHVRAHVVVSNPPYIALGEAAELPASVRDWEPAVALYSGGEGMSATARLVREAGHVLEAGGVLAIEVDARRASLAAELVSRAQCFQNIRVELDLTGRERFVLAIRR